MTRLSYDLTIWLLSHPLPALSRQKVVSLSQSSCGTTVELTDGKGGKGGGGRSQLIQPRKSLLLYKTFKTLLIFVLAKFYWYYFSPFYLLLNLLSQFRVF